MSTGAYSFLPWLRRGIATKITTDPGAAARAKVNVRLKLSGTAVSDGSERSQEVGHDVALYGPGDVVGVDPRAIVRTEPRDWVTNFDPNYLAFVEFYEEDYPWRYSPGLPDPVTGRLAPWLAVIVLTEEEFEEGGTLPGKPLPFIQVANLDILPPADQLGAFAHVHVNRRITASDTETVTDDMAAVLPRLAAVIAENPDLACSRLMCPRRLDPGAAYHAFLVPAFETGRLSGLGLDPAGAPGALHSSWVPYGNRPEPDRMPVYHRWNFRTTTSGDFEYLVRLLKPRTVDARVGNRDMDVQRPGAGLPAISVPELGGVLRLGGALKVPDTSLSEKELEEQEAYENWDAPFPHPFQQALAALINLADDYTDETVASAHLRLAASLGAGFPAAIAGLTAANGVTAEDPDPMITPPLYGRWPALATRLLTEANGDPITPDDNWLHELNLDPRFRVAAGIGGRIVRKHQEEFMAAAWAQLGDVLEANRRIRAAQLAREIGHALHTRQLEPLRAVAATAVLSMTAPLASRVVPQASSVAAGARTDRRTVAARLAASRVAGAPLSPAMRRVTRPGSRLMRRLPFEDLADRHRLIDKVNSGRVAAAPPKRHPDGVVTVDRLEEVLNPRAPRPRGEDGRAIPDPVDDLPNSPNFVISLPGDDVRPRPGDTDSEEATRFKSGLHEAYEQFNVADEAGQVPPREEDDVATLAAATLAELHPDLTVPRRVLGAISLPERFAPQAEVFVEAMAYPVIDTPMYKPLVDESKELFLPNLNLVPPDSITLLETNQRFIEAYMVGLNHEMARELLWREYPTDQRGSYFRQFWDPRAVIGKPGETAEQRRERLYDIPKLHLWSKASKLGEHDHREEDAATEEEVVLVIRGELLKKYPTAVIYAHHAKWHFKADGTTPDTTKERFLEPLEPHEEANPPRSKIRFPLYDAKAEPDIYFFGFDLTEEEARGGSGDPAEPGGTEAGWFFVIKERPGDPRFGLDIERTGELQVWNDLAWPDVVPASANGDPVYLRLDQNTVPRTLTEPTAAPDQEKRPQWEEDRFLTWHRQINAADAAYILYQAPVLVGVHAKEMLRREGQGDD